MELFRKQIINIATIFSLILVSFSFVRLLPIGIEWQVMAIAVIVAVFYFMAIRLMHGQAAEHTRLTYKFFINAEVKIFKNTGHVPFLEKSLEFNDLVLSFLKK